jgi:tripartite ATP-independent transporter DctM subunit
LFAAGILAGLILMVVYMITVALIARSRGFKPAREKRASFRELVASLKETIWALIFPIVLIGSLRLGIFTPTEVGAFACVYALVIGFFVYRDLTWESLKKTMKEAVRDMGAIMYMIAMAGIFGYGVPIDKIPQKMTSFIIGISSEPLVVLAIIVFFLVLFGMFMEGSIIILLLTPILIPLVKSIGFDTVVFGVMMSVVVTMGILTPPVGVAMYIVCGTLECKLEDFMKESIPFIIAVIVTVTVYALFPQVLLFLPNLIYG